MDLSKSSIISSCNDLSYEAFKTCCVKKDYSVLGLGTPEELDNAWLKLWSEFCIISEDDNVRSFVNDYRQIVYLESRISRVKIFIEMLLDGYNIFAIKRLRQLGYNYPFNDKSYLNDLQRVTNKVNNDVAKLTILMKNLKDIHEEDTTKKSLTSAMFDEKLSQMERVFKVPINPATLSAQMYAIKIREMREYIIRQTDTD